MSSAKSKLDAQFVRELAGILNDAELSEVEVEHEGYRIRVSKSAPTVAAAPPQFIAPPPAPAPVATAAPAASAPQTADATPAAAGAITSPMVGTVYHAAEPGADPFVTVGSKVKKGDTLMLIEAMKTFNPVESPRDGTVAQIIAEDGQPIEFGEPLIVVE